MNNNIDNLITAHSWDNFYVVHFFEKGILHMNSFWFCGLILPHEIIQN